jgi:hypothetical protein
MRRHQLYWQPPEYLVSLACCMHDSAQAQQLVAEATLMLNWNAFDTSSVGRCLLVRTSA